jgi:Flp pilus assembly protein TadG
MRDLIARLAHRVRRQGRDERGAVAVLVGVLIGGGVLIGMGAMTIDVGQLYQERAELQNGADAAALGVAKTCALGACNPAVATSYADANASRLTGGTAGVYLVCGSGGMSACPGSTGGTNHCPPPPNGVNYADVTTSTLTASGSTLLPPVFARALLGNSSYQGSAVGACAQAEWGAPASATVTAVTISACEWDQATSNGTLFAPSPPYPPDPLPAPSLDQVLRPTTSSSSTGCATEQAGADAAGTFGWTANSGTCSLAVSGTRYGTGAISQACVTALDSSQDNQTPIFVPIYVSVTGANYTLKGFAAFVVTGYNLAGISDPDWLNPQNSCQGSDVCVNGYFTQAVMPYTGSFGGTNLGASVINLTG